MKFVIKKIDPFPNLSPTAYWCGTAWSALPYFAIKFDRAEDAYHVGQGLKANWVVDVLEVD